MRFYWNDANATADGYVMLASGRVLIGSVRSRDAGRYRCCGYNDVIDARAWSPASYRLRVVDGEPELDVRLGASLISSSSSSSFIRHNKVRNVKLMKHTAGKTYQAHRALK